MQQYFRHAFLMIILFYECIG